MSKKSAAVPPLRDRIAEALFDACCRYEVPDAERRGMADAVIEALALHQEYDPYSEPESSRHRYVTEWSNDE